MQLVYVYAGLLPGPMYTSGQSFMQIRTLSNLEHGETNKQTNQHDGKHNLFWRRQKFTEKHKIIHFNHYVVRSCYVFTPFIQYSQLYSIA